MTTTCVVQARVGSARLPGKVLAELGGRPMLAFMLDRLSQLKVDRVVVATSVAPRDDAVEEVAEGAGVAVVRGPEQDVLARFARALDVYPCDTVVRLTADCPLTDPELVSAVVEHHLETGADYTSNVLPRTYPQGLDVEVATADALRTADREAVDPEEREHVMPFLYRRPERFRLANLRSGDWLGDLRWTVDTPADLAELRRIVSLLPSPGADWRAILRVAGPGPRDARPVRLRPAGPADSGRLLAWRNDPVAVRHSVHGQAVEPASHARWLAEVLRDPGRRLLVGEVDGEPVASFRLDVEAGVAELSIVVAPERRAGGLGGRLLAALQELLATDQQVVSVVAVVAADNEPSRRLFESAAFTFEVAEGRWLRYRWNTHVSPPLRPGAEVPTRVGMRPAGTE